MRRDVLLSVLSQLGNNVGELLGGIQAKNQYEDWRKQYGIGAPQQTIDVPTVGNGNPFLPTPLATERVQTAPSQYTPESMADLVSRLGGNPFGQKYLEGANIAYQGQRERQAKAEQKGREIRDRKDAMDREAAQTARQDQADRSRANLSAIEILSKLGQMPDPQFIQSPQFSDVVTGRTAMPSTFQSTSPVLGPPQPGQTMGSIASEKPVWSPVPKKPDFDVVPGQYVGANGEPVIPIMGADGQVALMPLTGARFRPSEKSGGGGAEKERPWGQTKYLNDLHERHRQIGDELKDLSRQYEELRSAPSTSKDIEFINPSTGQTERRKDVFGQPMYTKSEKRQLLDRKRAELEAESNRTRQQIIDSGGAVTY